MSYDIDSLLNFETEKNITCMVGKQISEVSDINKEAALQIIKMLKPSSGFTGNELKRKLHRVGFITSESTLLRHRNKTCVCYTNTEREQDNDQL